MNQYTSLVQKYKHQQFKHVPHTHTHHVSSSCLSAPGSLHSHLHLNDRMRVVVTDLKVLRPEVVDVLHFPQDL